MGHTTRINFDDSDAFTFNTTTTEITGGVARLKDLGGGTYSTANPRVTTQNRIVAEAITSFTESATKPAGTEIKYQLAINGSHYWYSSTLGRWTEIESPASVNYTEANTAAEIQANLAELVADLNLTPNFHFNVRVFLHSDDGTARPSLAYVEYAYTHDELAVAAPSECLLYVYLSDLLGAAYDYDSAKPATLYVKAPRPILHSSRLIRPFTKSVDFNSDGYAEISVIETETLGEDLEFFITYYEGNSKKTVKLHNAQVPSQATAALSSVTSVRPESWG